MPPKVREQVTFTDKLGNTRQLPKLYGDPRNANRLVLLDGTKGVIVENTDKGYIEVAK